VKGKLLRDPSAGVPTIDTVSNIYSNRKRVAPGLEEPADYWAKTKGQP
jgi:hypothetical protein